MNLNKAKLVVEEFFNGQYEVRKFLGEGSFSEVYLVKHNFLEDLRAMKIIKEPIKPSTNTKNVFREVQLATQLRHQNIINIYDAGIIRDDEDLAYFVMEYVPGGDLEEYLNSFINSNISMPINRVLNLMKQILRGLNTLHTSNPPIVHRDLKLNNILLNYNACGEIEIKISDFGFSKEVTTGISEIDIVGTRPYMAPECFDKVASTMTDIYAVGVIFYRLLTARYPYDVDKYGIDELLELKPWKSDLKRPSYFNDKVPERVDEIVLKCLEFDFKKRYQNARELLDDVELIIDEVKSKNEFEQLNVEMEYVDDYSEYSVNVSLIEAFKLAKEENGLNEAIEILEREVLRDYDVRRQYGETLRMWKSERSDVKLISKAFTVNLKAKNYQLSCELVKEAIAFNPSLKDKYAPYIDLWNIFIDLSKDNNLIKAVIALEELMQSSKEINDIYYNVINVLKTFDVDEIVAESIRSVKMNNLVDAANLMEFAVVHDFRLRQKYEYKLSLWKQNLEVYYKNSEIKKGATVDYAIDLGTSDSVMSYYDGENAIIIKNHNTGEDFTPSAVMIDSDNEITVGEAAKDAIIENDTNAIAEFKHDMGFAIPFKSESSTWLLYPEELSAEVLKDLRVSAYEQCGVNVEHAVVCVPANSNPLKTRAIREACELAGFRSYNLIYEPIAVAVAYDLKASEGQNGLWMIYDLGGSTFNVSLIQDNGKTIEMIATSGFDNLGGNLLDWRIVEELLVPKITNDLHLNDFKRSNSKYDEVFSRLKKACEVAKINLSDCGESEIHIPNLFEGYDFNYDLGDDEFKEVIKPIIENTFNLSHDLLFKNSFEINDVDKIILVGGSCISPTIQGLVEDEFKLPVDFSINPLTVVAKGAAVYAGNLKRPSIEPTDNSCSVMLNKDNGIFHGRLFNLDRKFSFLGYDIEFIGENSSLRVPVDFEGKFKIGLDEGEYSINVYKHGELIMLDDKSPDRISNGSIHIPFFKKYFDFSNDKIVGYDDLINSIDYLNEYEMFDDWKALDYLERLIAISKVEKSALTQANIYLHYLEDVAANNKKDLGFLILLDNVKNKTNLLDERIDLTSIIENKDFKGLKKIHKELIEEYVRVNRDKVIEECFFNLRHDGVYTRNLELSKELIEKGILESNHRKLFGIVNRLYQIDERQENG